MRHGARWIAGAGVVVAVILAGVTVVLGWGRPEAGDLPAFGPVLIIAMLPFLVYAVVGAVVASRRPRHPIGWLLLLIGVAMTGQVALEEYAVQAVVLRPGELPASMLVDWAAEWLWVFPLSAMHFTALLFPDGRLPSPRWRTFAGVVALGDLLLAVALPIALWPLRGTISLGDEVLLQQGLGAVVDPLIGCLLLALVVALLSLGLRYRRGDREERSQLRLLAFAAGLLAAGLVTGGILSGPLGVEGSIAALPPIVGTSVLPIALAIAVLRHDLFDLGRIVSRTVSYALLTGVLVGVYALGVLGIGALLPGEPSDLLVAGSTLAVAALFRPLRSRIQAVVDRRFNRSRYDAGLTVEAFGARLRDEVDLGTLGAELRGVVVQTVQPAAVRVWLREASR